MNKETVYNPEPFYNEHGEIIDKGGGWYKVVKHIDLSLKNGYAFGGEFIWPGTDYHLATNSLILKKIKGKYGNNRGNPPDQWQLGLLTEDGQVDFCDLVSAVKSKNKEFIKGAADFVKQAGAVFLDDRSNEINPIRVFTGNGRIPEQNAEDNGKNKYIANSKNSNNVNRIPEHNNPVMRNIVQTGSVLKFTQKPGLQNKQPDNNQDSQQLSFINKYPKNLAETLKQITKLINRVNEDINKTQILVAEVYNQTGNGGKIPEEKAG